MIEYWFPSPIIRTKISNSREILNDLLPYLNELWTQPDALIPPWIGTSTGGHPNYSSFPTKETMDQGGKLLHQRSEMKDAIDQIMPHVLDYFNLLKVDKNLKPEITDMWCQTYISGIGFMHNHSEFLIGGGLYLECQGLQQMVFEHPHALLYEPHIRSSFPKESLEITVDVEEGDLILWPGWMNHMVVAQAPAGWPNNYGSRISLPFMINGVPQ
jgi:hypothetical protein